ncbi:MAG: O-antigen ligase family protein [Planctomycetes bacterium]|nr:O-antigen ligase family protein [Planctomycetota bacterium]
MNRLTSESGAERLLAQREILELLCRVLAAGIVALAIFKASVGLIAFPGWDMDPMAVAAPPVGLGPTATLATDSALITLSGACIALASPIVGGFSLIVLALLLAGTGAVAWHGLFSPHAVQEHLTAGLGWVSALCAAVALTHAARIESVRRIGAAVALGFLAFLAVKCALQVWVDLPETIEQYKANRGAMLASHGWAPDSFAARTFERRLYDTAGTGWFGLSNVVATFGAAGASCSLGLVVYGEKKRRGLPVVGLVTSLLCLWLASSKGGWAAALVGSGVAIVGPALVRGSWARGALLVLGAPCAALAAVLARGMAGERLGELSLLFRAQYAAAAARIFGSHPTVGVGPAGFKDAYLLAKNPLNPEEVSSPHSVLFDFAATLGMGGLAWGVILLALLGLAGAAIARDDEGAVHPRREFRIAVIALAMVSIAGAWIESAIATPLSGVGRIVALGAACAIAWCVCSTTSRALRIGLAASAAACGFHAMIEVTPVNAGSAALFACFVGLAASGASAPELAIRRGFVVRAAPGLSIACLGIGVSVLCGRVQDWEGHLRAGAARLEPVAWLAQELAINHDEAGVRGAAEQLGRVLGRKVEPSRHDVQGALLEAKLKIGGESFGDLIAAIARDPTSFDTRQAASGLSLQLAAIEKQLGVPELGPEHNLRIRSAIDLAEDATRLPLRRAAAEAWFSNANRGVWDLTGDRRWLEAALRASIRAGALDPWNPTHAATAARLAGMLGEADQARTWAERALELDENMRLDPLRRFPAEERAELERLKRLAPATQP